jgi:hypothetical protein
MITPIIWKEWRQQRWKLAFGTVMLVGLIGTLATAHVMNDAEIFAILGVASALVLPLYSAMGVFAPEHTGGTFTFYASKPAKPLAVFMTKWFFGWLNVVVPVTAAFVFTLLVSGNSLPGFLACLVNILENPTPISFSLCFGTILYTMTCCFAPSKSSEAFVGLTGLLILLIMMAYLLAVSYLFDNIRHIYFQQQPTLLQQMLFALSPLSFFASFFAPFFGGGPLHQRFRCILHLEQGIIFLLTLWFGYRKWRRHW